MRTVSTTESIRAGNLQWWQGGLRQYLSLKGTQHKLTRAGSGLGLGLGLGVPERARRAISGFWRLVQVGDPPTTTTSPHAPHPLTARHHQSPKPSPTTHLRRGAGCRRREPWRAGPPAPTRPGHGSPPSWWGSSPSGNTGTGRGDGLDVDRRGQKWRGNMNSHSMGRWIPPTLTTTTVERAIDHR